MWGVRRGESETPIRVKKYYTQKGNALCASAPRVVLLRVVLWYVLFLASFFFLTPYFVFFFLFLCIEESCWQAIMQPTINWHVKKKWD
jgi:hypothetical protein